MNKKQFELHHDIKAKNAFMRKQKVPYRVYAVKSQFGDYRLKWDLDSSNLPQSIIAQKHKNELLALFYEERKGIQYE